MKNILPLIKITLESSPNFNGYLFHKMNVAAENGELITNHRCQMYPFDVQCSIQSIPSLKVFNRQMEGGRGEGNVNKIKIAGITESIAVRQSGN